MPDLGRRWRSDELTPGAFGIAIRRAFKFYSPEEVATLTGIDPRIVAEWHSQHK